MIDDIFNKIITEALETEDEFIFTRIRPFCEEKLVRKISKSDLVNALSQYFNPKTNFDKWTPVSDPPKEDDRYLVTLHDIHFGNAIGILRYSHNLHELDKYDFPNEERAGWCTYDNEWGYIEYNNVIAWMSLPKPYKEIDA